MGKDVVQEFRNEHIARFTEYRINNFRDWSTAFSMLTDEQYKALLRYGEIRYTEVVNSEYNSGITIISKDGVKCVTYGVAIDREPTNEPISIRIKCSDGTNRKIVISKIDTISSISFEQKQTIKTAAKKVIEDIQYILFMSSLGKANVHDKMYPNIDEQLMDTDYMEYIEAGMGKYAGMYEVLRNNNLEMSLHMMSLYTDSINEYMINSHSATIEDNTTDGMFLSGSELGNIYKKLLSDDYGELFHCALNEYIHAKDYSKLENEIELNNLVNMSSIIEKYRDTLEEYMDAFDDTDRLLKYKISTYIMRKGTKSRIATRGEVEALARGIEYSEKPYIPESKAKGMALVNYVLTADKSVEHILKNKCGSYIRNVLENYDDIYANVEFIGKSYSEVESDCMNRVKQLQEEYGQPTKDIPEVTEQVSFSDVMEWAANNADKLTDSESNMYSCAMRYNPGTIGMASQSVRGAYDRVNKVYTCNRGIEYVCARNEDNEGSEEREVDRAFVYVNMKKTVCCIYTMNKNKQILGAYSFKKLDKLDNVKMYEELSKIHKIYTLYMRNSDNTAEEICGLDVKERISCGDELLRTMPLDESGHKAKTIKFNGLLAAIPLDFSFMYYYLSKLCESKNINDEEKSSMWLGFKVALAISACSAIE